MFLQIDQYFIDKNFVITSDKILAESFSHVSVADATNLVNKFYLVDSKGDFASISRKNFDKIKKIGRLDSAIIEFRPERDFNGYISSAYVKLEFIYDNENHLSVVRGNKNLYLYLNNKHFIFSSDILIYPKATVIAINSIEAITEQFCTFKSRIIKNNIEKREELYDDKNQLIRVTSTSLLFHKGTTDVRLFDNGELVYEFHNDPQDKRTTFAYSRSGKAVYIESNESNEKNQKYICMIDRGDNTSYRKITTNNINKIDIHRLDNLIYNETITDGKKDITSYYQDNPVYHVNDGKLIINKLNNNIDDEINLPEDAIIDYAEGVFYQIIVFLAENAGDYDKEDFFFNKEKLLRLLKNNPFLKQEANNIQNFNEIFEITPETDNSAMYHYMENIKEILVQSNTTKIKALYDQIEQLTNQKFKKSKINNKNIEKDGLLFQLAKKTIRWGVVSPSVKYSIWYIEAIKNIEYLQPNLIQSILSETNEVSESKNELNGIIDNYYLEMRNVSHGHDEKVYDNFINNFNNFINLHPEANTSDITLLISKQYESYIQDSKLLFYKSTGAILYYIQLPTQIEQMIE